MTSAPAELVAQLRDIHLPEPVSFWPPAPGWWGVFAVLVILFAGAFWWRRRSQKTGATEPSPLLAALAMVDQLEGDFARHGDGVLLAANLSQLLKQAALTRFDRNSIAPLWGEKWLEFLDQSGGHTLFTQGVGRTLAEATYRPHVAVDPQPLLALTRGWLNQVLGEVKHDP